MLITFHRTGGLLALLVVATAALATAVVTIAVAATLAVAAVAIAGVVLVGRAVLPRSWLVRTGPPATPWPHETIDSKVVTPARSSDRRDLLRQDGDRG